MKADEEKRAKELAGMQASQDSEMAKLQEQQQQKVEMEERRRIMIRQLLEPDAVERLNRVGLVKPEKQQRVEEKLLVLAQSGQITEKIGDSQLVSILEKLDQVQAPAQSKIKFKSKRCDDDEDDIDLDNL
mmetsp:Transcript_15826/g.31058  ORF Transcript_15826/g.31058 Transcript_15826/m.31058 type:complete len:130 (+) Transcript_15826:81-470(+)